MHILGSDEVTFSDGCSGEYVEVQWGGGRVVRCAEQQGPWLENYVFPQEIKVFEPTTMVWYITTCLMGGTAHFQLRPHAIRY